MSNNTNYPNIKNSQNNFNIHTFLNSQKTNNDLNPNIFINNSAYIPFTTQSIDASVSDHSNASIYLKDTVLSGNGLLTWQQIKAADNDLYFSNSIVLTENNAADILANIYLYEPSNVSNIIVTGGYINFFNGNNTTQGSNGVGIRYSNEHVQFRNYTDGQWYDITTLSTANLSNLNDVEITNVINNQYLKWNSSSNLWINSNLAIINDPIPSLGGNLTINNYQFLISNSGSAIFNDIGDNKVLEIKDNTTGSGNSNYIIINNSITGNEPSIEANGDDTDVSINIISKGDGNIILDSNGGNTYINSAILDISGIIKSSIYRSNYKSGGYSPSTSWNIPLSSDVLLFNFDNSNSAGTYWANVGVGIEGQKINFIMYNSGNVAIDVLVDFGTNGLGSGNGLASKMKFHNSGQGASLIYLGTPALWQILNTGAIIL